MHDRPPHSTHCCTAPMATRSLCSGRMATSSACFAPGARAVKLLKPDGTELATARPVHGGAIFEAKLDHAPTLSARIDWGGHIQVTEDPYSFGLLLADFDTFPPGRRHASRSRLLPRRAADARQRCPRRALRRLGPQCAARFRRRQFQQLGRPPPSDAPPQCRHLGNLHPPPRLWAKSTNTKSSARTACCR